VVFYCIGCWLFGLVWVGVLSALAPSEQRWVVVLTRGLFVAGVAVVVGATAVIVAAGNTTSSGSAVFGTITLTRKGLWVYSLGCAIPVTLLGLLVVRRALPRRLPALVATVPVLVVLAASAAAFRPVGAKLDGLASTAHRHHGGVVAVLVVPVVLLAAMVTAPRAR
jgi:MFS superfamily sulfate permease-like transporter